jgi:hypothetical protein
MKRLLAYPFIILGLGLLINITISSNGYAAGKWKIGYKIYPKGKVFYSTSKKEEFADAKAFHKCQRGGKKKTYNTELVCLKFKSKDPNGTTKDHWNDSIAAYENSKNKNTQIVKLEKKEKKLVVEKDLSPNKGKSIDKDFYKFKKISIPLSKDGQWKLIGKKKRSVHDVDLTWKYIAQLKGNNLSKIIEVVHVTGSKYSADVVASWFKKFTFQTNGYKSCIPKSGSGQSANLREKYYVYEEVNSSVVNCFFTRNMNTDDEIINQLVKRNTSYVDTNILPNIVKDFIGNEIKLPKIMLRSDHYFYSKNGLYAYFEMINPEVNGAPKTLFISEKENEYYPSNINAHPEKKDFYLNWIKIQAKNHLEFENKLIKNQKYKLDLAKYIGDGVIKDFENNKEQTQIAKVEPTSTPKKKIKVIKTEPTIEPKKKVKVAKVEPKKEEFKPKKTNQDNEAPVIEIAEAITVKDTSYILEGSVTDKADKIFLEIDGQPVQVKKGKFKVKRYSPVDEQIKIVAIDQWGNKSKTKLVNITIDIDKTVIAKKLEPLNPSNISNPSSDNKVALVIGIENYTEAPKANYANLDAKYFFDYARRAFGVKKQNINLLVNEEATVVKTDKAVSLWLKSKVKKNKSDLIIFFAGHGLASSNGKELYLLPQDGNPDRLERTALSRTDLFKEIINLSPKSVTIFLDTCYSGVSRDEQMLLASARPIRIIANEQEGIPDNFTIFSASQLDQISSGLKEANHGIFSYYLMKGLEGNADINQDNDITNGELLAYMDENISQKAAEQGREQNPSLAGDPDKIIISY